MLISHGAIGSPFATFRKIVTNRTGATLAVGDLVQFDIEASGSQDADTSSGNGPGGITGLDNLVSIWANVVNPAAAALTTGTVYALVSDLGDGAGADNTDVTVVIWGDDIDVKIAFDADIGSKFMPGATAGNREVAAYADASGNSSLGIIKSNTDGSSTATVGKCLFNGFGAIFGGAGT